MTGSLSVSRRPLVVVPVGAFEQHGSHLPFDTDSRIAGALVASAVATLTAHDRAEVFIAPTVPVSASDEHIGFIGTLSAGTEATASMLAGIARSAASWSRGTLFVNGHGGNADALTSVRAMLQRDGIAHDMWWPRLPHDALGDLHAGRIETSVMLHIAPETVDMSKATPGATGDPSALIATMREGGVAAVSPNGVIGDPTGANAADGEAVFVRWTSELATTIESRLRAWTPSTE